MFQKIKISTGINLLNGAMLLFLVVLAGFIMQGALTSYHNFEDNDTIDKHQDYLAQAMYDMTSAQVVINNMLLLKTKNEAIQQKDLDNVRLLLSKSKENMGKFISLPFVGTEEKAKGLDVKNHYDLLLTITNDALNYVLGTGLEASHSKEVNTYIDARDVMRQKVAEYNVVSNLIADSKTEAIESGLFQLIFLSIIFVVISIVLNLVGRVWVKRAVLTRLDDAKTAFQLIASGNLSHEIEVGAKNEIGLMMMELEKMRGSLTELVENIRGGVTLIHSNVHEIASSNNDLSSRTEQQASALQETAASMEELKITVRQNADNAHSAKQLAENASTSARKGGDVMINLDGIMRHITDNSRQIADINSVIDSIANQTNILALNAAVEAARAGEQGRGFAVVAGEVRNLAKRSADAAKEIRQLITTSVSNIDTGSQEVESANVAMQEIVKSVTQVTDIMAEITSASDEQSTGINQIAQAVNEMDLVTQQNAAMVEQAATIAHDVEEHASNLDGIVSKFVLDSLYKVTRVNKTPSGVYSNMIKSEPGVNSSQQDDNWETF